MHAGNWPKDYGIGVLIILVILTIIVFLFKACLYGYCCMPRKDEDENGPYDINGNRARKMPNFATHVTDPHRQIGALQSSRSQSVLRETHNEVSPPCFDVALDMPYPYLNSGQTDQLPSYSQIMKTPSRYPS